MKQNVLATNETGIERDLKKLEISAQKFQPLLSAMIKHEYEPSTGDFHEIIYGRKEKRDNPLDDFLRMRTVKKHPAIDTLPITQFMKKTMIELPKECKEIMSIYDAIPTQSTFLADVYKMELIDGKVCLSEVSKQAIIDSYTIYANELENEAFVRANEVLKSLIKLQEDFGINFFQRNLIQCNEPNTLKGATLKAEGVKYVVSEFSKHHKI